MRKHFTKATTLNIIVVKRLLLTNSEIQSSQGNGFIAISCLNSIVFTRIDITMTCDC